MKFKTLQLIVFSYLLQVFIFLSCSNTANQNQLRVQEQGVFEFLNDTDDIDEDTELPANIDPSAVLCFGKGLKVGRCISKQLETGMCIGLSKHHKHVIAIEIPCTTVTKESTKQIMITE